MTPNPLREIHRGALEIAAPPEDLSVLAWAERERRLTRGVSAIEGRFHALPFQRQLLENITSRKYSEHIWMMAAQAAGKTEMVNSTIGYFIDQEPCGIMVVYPTLDRAKDYSKKKLARMVASTPSLRRKIRSSRARDSGNTVLSKEFIGGDIILSGSNSPSSLRSSSRRVVIQDEIDSYEASAGSEGDPCALADTRAENFSNAVFIKASTPTIRGRSRIEEKWEDSTRSRFHVPCPHCGEFQWLKWKQVRWPEDKPEAARYVCEKCGSEWTDAERIRAIHVGKWVDEQPDSRRFGAQMSGLYRMIGLKDSYVSFLHEFAANFLKAKHSGPLTIRAWQNTFLAETYEEEGESVEGDAVAERAEDYTPEAMPEGVLLLVAGADVQKDRIEIAVFGIGKDEENWAIEKKTFDGDPEQDEVWSNLDAYLETEFTREDNVKLKLERTFIDMQFKTPRVLGFCAPRLGRGIYPCRGLNRVGVNVPPLLPARPTRNNRARIPHWNVGVTVAKTMIHDRLQLPTPGPRTMHFPRGFGFDAEYFKQLTSEKRRTRYSYGQAYSIFEKAYEGIRNEALDISVYALGALASMMPVGWTKRAEFLKTLVPAPATAPNPAKIEKPAPTPQPAARRPMVARRGWVNAW